MAWWREARLGLGRRRILSTLAYAVIIISDLRVWKSRFFFFFVESYWEVVLSQLLYLRPSRSWTVLHFYNWKLQAVVQYCATVPRTHRCISTAPRQHDLALYHSLMPRYPTCRESVVLGGKVIVLYLLRSYSQWSRCSSEGSSPSVRNHLRQLYDQTYDIGSFMLSFTILCDPHTFSLVWTLNTHFLRQSIRIRYQHVRSSLMDRKPIKYRDSSTIGLIYRSYLRFSYGNAIALYPVSD